MNNMYAELKGYTINFVFRDKNIHIKSHDINEKQKSSLEALGLTVVVDKFEGDPLAGPDEQTELEQRFLNSCHSCIYSMKYKQVCYGSTRLIKAEDANKICQDKFRGWTFDKGVIVNGFCTTAVIESFKMEDLLCPQVLNEGEVLLNDFFKEARVKSVDFSGCCFEDVGEFFCTFEDCSELRYINFTNCDLSKITQFQGAFKNSGLKKIDLSSAKINANANFALAFSGCSQLEEINLSNCKSKSFNSYSFKNCTSLKRVILCNCPDETVRAVCKAIPNDYFVDLITGSINNPVTYVNWHNSSVSILYDNLTISINYHDPTPITKEMVISLGLDVVGDPPNLCIYSTKNKMVLCGDVGLLDSTYNLNDWVVTDAVVGNYGSANKISSFDVNKYLTGLNLENIGISKNKTNTSGGLSGMFANMNIFKAL